MLSKSLVIGDVMHEWSAVRRLFESLPDEHFDWKPHSKSFALSELATHIVNLLNWQLAILRYPELDLAATPARRTALTTRQALLDEYDTNIGELKRTLDALDEETLASNWTLRRGDSIMLVQPKVMAFRSIGMSHMIHHRAQLGVYLRLLDLPVPGMYGPTADDLGKS